MLIRVVLLLAILLPSVSYAQAFKCRTSTGKVVISNEGCPSSSRLEQITTAAPVTLEGRRQAAEVNARAQYQLDGIARENAAFTQQLRRQQIAQASIDAQENQEKSGMKQGNGISVVLMKRCATANQNSGEWLQHAMARHTKMKTPDERWCAGTAKPNPSACDQKL